MVDTFEENQARRLIGVAKAVGTQYVKMVSLTYKHKCYIIEETCRRDRSACAP